MQSVVKHMPKAKDRRKVFIVDDHPVFREGLEGLIGREPDLEVCGTADSAPAALTRVQRTQPALTLVDIGLPGKSGLELIKDLRAVCATSAILVISMFDETLYAERVLRAGGRGYIMKEEGAEKILQAVRQVLEGQVYVSGPMSSRVLDAFAGRRSRAKSPIGRLTDREFEIFQLIGQGKNSHAIAERLHLSFKTVDTHRGHLKEKLSLKSGTELICYAARWIETQIPLSSKVREE